MRRARFTVLDNRRDRFIQRFTDFFASHSHRAGHAGDDIAALDFPCQFFFERERGAYLNLDLFRRALADGRGCTQCGDISRSLRPSHRQRRAPTHCAQCRSRRSPRYRTFLPPMSTIILPTGSSTGMSHTDGGRHRLVHQMHFFRTGGAQRRSRRFFHFRDTGRNADHDARLHKEERIFLHPFNERLQQDLDQLKISDHAVFHGAHRDVLTGSPSEHFLASLPIAETWSFW